MPSHGIGWLFRATCRIAWCQQWYQGFIFWLLLHAADVQSLLWLCPTLLIMAGCLSSEEALLVIVEVLLVNFPLLSRVPNLVPTLFDVLFLRFSGFLWIIDGPMNAVAMNLPSLSWSPHVWSWCCWWVSHSVWATKFPVFLYFSFLSRVDHGFNWSCFAGEFNFTIYKGVYANWSAWFSIFMEAESVWGGLFVCGVVLVLDVELYV